MQRQHPDAEADDKETQRDLQQRRQERLDFDWAPRHRILERLGAPAALRNVQVVYGARRVVLPLLDVHRDQEAHEAAHEAREEEGVGV